MHMLLEVGLGNAAAAAALALVAAAVARLSRRPALAHALWLLVLLKLVTPPLLPLPVSWSPADDRPAAASETASAAPDSADHEEDAAPPLEVLEATTAVAPAEEAAPREATPLAAAVPWADYLLLAWLVGTLLWFAWAGLHVRRFRRLLRHTHHASEVLQAEADVLARRLGLKQSPSVWLVPGAVSPMVWAVGQTPCVLFPSGLLDRLEDRERASLLAHELAHVRRWDHWVRLLEFVVSGLYWWHPVVWWARSELREAEEQCCDAWAVWALEGDGRPYARALLQAAAFISHARWPLPVGASGIGHVRSLKRRLTMVMQARTPRSLSWAGRAAVLVLGLLLLPLFAARAQTPPPAKDSRDQQIDILKQALKLLEEQKRAEGTGLAPMPVVPQKAPDPSPKTGEGVAPVERQHSRSGPGLTPSQNIPATGPFAPGTIPAGSEDANPAMLKDLEKVIAVKRKELQDLEKKHQEVLARIKDQGGNAPVTATEKTQGAPVSPMKRSEDVEKRLDRLLKEVEELRRDIQRGGSSVPQGPSPAGPLKPPGTNSFGS
jgi:beta-lactamase regulating signal transducer with metallopeptidase domain